MTFLDENNAYLDCVNDEINTTSANGKMISRLLMSVSQNEIANNIARKVKPKDEINNDKNNRKKNDTRY